MRIDIGNNRSGITIEYVKSRKRIMVHGHYDSIVGIEGEWFDLADFCKRLGIDAKTLESVALTLKGK